MMRVLDGLTFHFYSALDIKGKFAFALPYRRCTSKNADDFFKKFQQVYRLPIHDVQSDNGSEFLGEFDTTLKAQGIPHLFSYPRCPKINGCVERFQRTLNEEFVQVHQDRVRDERVFHKKLADYLLFYNCDRVHEGLDLQTPMQYLIAERAMSKMSVTCTPSIRASSSML